MSFAPDVTEIIARARADLRMGVPVVLTANGQGVLMMAVETVEAQRLADLRALGGQPVLAITARRAETLKARVYDGDVARIAVPDGVPCDWLHSIADPADDMSNPMKGPLKTLREGSADLHRVAIALAKSARLLPAALMLEVSNPAGFAAANMLTTVPADLAGPLLLQSPQPHPVVSARLPVEASEAGRLHIYRPEDGGEEHYAFEVGAPARDEPVLIRFKSKILRFSMIYAGKYD